MKCTFKCNEIQLTIEAKDDSIAWQQLNKHINNIHEWELIEVK